MNVNDLGFAWTGRPFSLHGPALLKLVLTVFLPGGLPCPSEAHCTIPTSALVFGGNIFTHLMLYVILWIPYFCPYRGRVRIVARFRIVAGFAVSCRLRSWVLPCHCVVSSRLPIVLVGISKLRTSSTNDLHLPLHNCHIPYTLSPVWSPPSIFPSQFENLPCLPSVSLSTQFIIIV